MSDINPFNTMQSNPKVMQYVTGEIKSLEAHQEELKQLIQFYDKEGNNFWIYAIERKSDKEFIGTCAFIKDDKGDDELGYRFLENYWRLGYGYEICTGIVNYSQSVGIPKLIGYVVDVNIASAKILEKCNFKVVDKGIEPHLNLPETKYELML